MHGFVKVASGMNVSEAAKVMDRELASSLLVEKGGKVVGIMTERDVIRKVVAKGVNPNTALVEEVMTSPILTIEADADVIEASRLMERYRIRHLVVVEGGKILGKVTVQGISSSFRYALARDMSGYSRIDYGKPQM